MREIQLSADDLAARLLSFEPDAKIGLLDSCGRTLGDSRFLIAGIYPAESHEFIVQSQIEALSALQFLDEKLAYYKNKSDLNKLFGGGACVVSLSYEFGAWFENLTQRPKKFNGLPQPSATFSFYETLFVHDYAAQKTFIVGKDAAKFERLITQIKVKPDNLSHDKAFVSANFSKEEYLAAVRAVKNHIQLGDVYQANLTQQFCVRVPVKTTPESVFARLRKNHPAPFAAFLRRENDAVVSASPERFLRVRNREIITSPIKGTRRRGANPAEDNFLRTELTNSVKDLAENVMIVDLLRNDIGRVCEFGSVKPVKMFEIEEHPTLFHLVSTIRGTLKNGIKPSDLLTATFPCGSITGAPKIRAMQILDDIETAPRGLSMGAIGCFGFDDSADFNVAIRTLTMHDQTAIFNVGGGIVAGSEPTAEYEESLIKARALLAALNA